MRAQPGRRSGLVAGAVAACWLCLAVFAAGVQGAKTYPTCNPGQGSDTSCIVGTSFGAVFDGNPGNRYKLCVTPSGRDRDCKRFKVNGRIVFFRGGDSYDLDEGRGYSYVALTGIGYKPTCRPPYQVGQPCGHLTVRWYDDGRKIDRDRLTVVVGD